MSDTKGRDLPSSGSVPNLPWDPIVTVFRHCRPEQTESFRVDLDYSAAPKDYGPIGFDMYGGRMVRRNNLWYFCHKNILYDLKYFACLIEVSYAKMSELRDRNREIYMRLWGTGSLFDMRGANPDW